MSINFFEYEISQSFPEFDIRNKQMIINTINPHSFCVAEDDKKFKEALIKSDILIPDGIGIVWRLRFLRSKKIFRITGADMHDYLLKYANSKKLRIFYLGSNEKTLKKITGRNSKDFDHIISGSFSPVYKDEFSIEDSLEMINAVNSFSPDILFIGMTAPKQEKWAYSYKEKLNAQLIVSIGAVFDFYAGNIKRAPKWMISLGLEWLFRFFLEPKRLWKRYVINNTRFILYIVNEKFNRG